MLPHLFASEPMSPSARERVPRPFTCDLAYENRFFLREARHLLFEVWKGKPYRALFIVQDDVVKILCIGAPGEKPVKPRDIEI
jgi:hypothetical protein